MTLFGIALATGAAMVSSTFLSPELFNQYGWRCLFFLGGLLGFFGVWMRNDLLESQVFYDIKAKRPQKIPFKIILQQQKTQVLSIFLLIIMSAAGVYVLMGYLTTYLQTYLHFTLAKSLQCARGNINKSTPTLWGIYAARCC